LRSIVNILKNDATLVALLGSADRVRTNYASQTQKTPFVIVDLEDSIPTNTFRTASDLDFERLVISSVADRAFTSGSEVGADEIGVAVRNAIDYVAAGTYDGEVLLRCTYERGSGMTEDRIANKPQITRTDEYLISIRP